jgi:purine-binding chemotaxis protein CheW
MATNRTTRTIKALLKLLSRPANVGAINDTPDEVKKSFLLFEIGEESFAVPVENIESVIDCPRITPLPYPPDGIIGVTSIHGKIVLVMKLSGKETMLAQKPRLILLQGDEHLGLLAQRIEDVVTVRVDDLQEGKKAQQKTFWSAAAYLENKQRQIAILDVEKLAEV